MSTLPQANDEIRLHFSPKRQNINDVAISQFVDTKFDIIRTPVICFVVGNWIELVVVGSCNNCTAPKKLEFLHRIRTADLVEVVSWFVDPISQWYKDQTSRHNFHIRWTLSSHLKVDSLRYLCIVMTQPSFWKQFTVKIVPKFLDNRPSHESSLSGFCMVNLVTVSFPQECPIERKASLVMLNMKILTNERLHTI